MSQEPKVLARRPSATITVRACDDMTAWDILLEMIKLAARTGVTSASVVVRSRA